MIEAYAIWGVKNEVLSNPKWGESKSTGNDAPPPVSPINGPLVLGETLPFGPHLI